MSRPIVKPLTVFLSFLASMTYVVALSEPDVVIFGTAFEDCASALPGASIEAMVNGQVFPATDHAEMGVDYYAIRIPAHNSVATLPPGSGVLVDDPDPVNRTAAVLINGQQVASLLITAGGPTRLDISIFSQEPVGCDTTDVCIHLVGPDLSTDLRVSIGACPPLATVPALDFLRTEAASMTDNGTEVNLGSTQCLSNDHTQEGLTDSGCNGFMARYGICTYLIRDAATSPGDYGLSSNNLLRLASPTDCP